MLFNSHIFIFIFLPIVLVAYIATKRWAAAYLTHVLVLASLVFYAWWDWRSLPILLISIFWNYSIAGRISRNADEASYRWLCFGVLTNLLALGYFKYFNFLGQNIGLLLGLEYESRDISLPLGISFFTFTQIAFLIDCYRSRQSLYSPINFGLFVTYFPHLIAGPILHHKEMMPQFDGMATQRVDSQNYIVGSTFFAIGLFKKAILADTCAIYATPVFQTAAAGGELTFLESWCGALSYTFQLYFDFSGYCDMAIGISWLFGIRLPLNFHSPYKAASVIEFWRRWHITLSRFLRDYVYFSLGGNRKGVARRYVNLMLTMILGGVWHGAGWTFAIWGLLHGLYLVVNHLWRELKERLGISSTAPVFFRMASTCVTFLAVVVGWVFFRAETVDAAISILRGMAGLNGLVLPFSYSGHFGSYVPELQKLGIEFGNAGLYQGAFELLWIVGMFVLVWAFPNTQEFVGKANPALADSAFEEGAPWLRWNESKAWAMVLGGMLGLAILGIAQQSEFLYFQF